MTDHTNPASPTQGGETPKIASTLLAELRAELATLKAERDYLEGRVRDVEYVADVLLKAKQEAEAQLKEAREQIEKLRWLAFMPDQDGELSSEEYTWKKEAEDFYKYATKTQIERDAALARVAELEQDRERLDWLETKDGAISHKSYGDYSHYFGDGFKPLRETIDVARAQEGGER